jgi:hypothetical protein
VTVQGASRGREAGVLPGKRLDREALDPGNVHIRRSEALPEVGKHLGSAGEAPRFPSPPPYRAGDGEHPFCRLQDTGRVVVHRHGPECAVEECPGCLPCPEEHCLTCHRNHAQTTCPECLALARSNLDAVRQLIHHLPAEAREGQHVYRIHEGIPGGDALVLLSPASTLRGRVGQTARPESELGDPVPPLDVLVFWEEWWRAEADQPTGLQPTLDRVADYLASQLHHIATSRVFPHLAKDLARTVRSVENVLHDGVRPEVSRVPCWECGARLEKVYGSQARHDHWACPRCHEVYDHGRYERAKYDHLASQGAERYVPVSDAIAATGRPEQTVRGWMRVGVVGTEREQGTGRLLVWWPDVRAQHLAAGNRKRA